MAMAYRLLSAPGPSKDATNAEPQSFPFVLEPKSWRIVLWTQIVSASVPFFTSFLPFQTPNTKVGTIHPPHPVLSVLVPETVV